MCKYLIHSSNDQIKCQWFFFRSSSDAQNIIDIAEKLQLIGPKFAWVLTSSSIGEVDVTSYTTFPEGLLGLLPRMFFFSIKNLNDICTYKNKKQ